MSVAFHQSIQNVQSEEEFTLMFHGVNELRKKVYPPHRPAALEAARRKRSVGDEHGTVLDTASRDADAKGARTTDESGAATPGDETMAA